MAEPKRVIESSAINRIVCVAENQIQDIEMRNAKMNENIDFMKRITAAERDSLINSGCIYTIYNIINNERTLEIEQCVKFLRDRAKIYKGGPRVCLQAAADALEETIEGEKDE